MITIRSTVRVTIIITRIIVRHSEGGKPGEGGVDIERASLLETTISVEVYVKLYPRALTPDFSAFRAVFFIVFLP